MLHKLAGEGEGIFLEGISETPTSFGSRVQAITGKGHNNERSSKDANDSSEVEFRKCPRGKQGSEGRGPATTYTHVACRHRPTA